MIICDLCGHNSFSQVLSGADYRTSDSSLYQLYKCLNCGLVCLLPQPGPQALHKSYPDFLWEINNTDRLSQRLNLSIEWLQRLRPLPGNLLDVGSAIGDFVLAAQQIGWHASGIEVSERQVEVANSRGANVVLCPDFLTFISDTKFDVITFNHVLEHVPSPAAYLLKAKSLLKPKGLIIISVPNYNSFSRRLFGKYWTHLDLPRHLFHFTPDTLSLYLKNSGFKPLQISFKIREDNSIGGRDSLRRWIKYGVLKQNLSNLSQLNLSSYSPNKLSFPAKVIRYPYLMFGNILASVTENLGIADTFILTAALIE
jgi:SAM-dependent methyltransferase